MGSEAFPTVVEAAERVARGEVTAEALAQEALRRLDTIGRSLNAVVTLTTDAPSRSARFAEPGGPISPTSSSAWWTRPQRA
ncbi:MAG TPA: hypothetical protein VLQ65_07355 [Saliniramus sp.]|nr:hypothetical protein [Saliniramus sp.]